MNQLNTLTQINLDDLISSFGWQNRPVLARILRQVFLKPARNFARIMVEFDKAVAELGLAEASRLTQKYFVREVHVFGLDLIPDTAFLALSNHPGMTDTLSAFRVLNRPDLKAIALDRPFLNALPNLSRQLLYLKDDSASRVSLVRHVTAHLRNNGAVLTFPAGHIEPDPDIYEGAADSLHAWTDSAGVFIRMAPQAAVLPILIRGVVWDKAARHFLLRIKKSREEREKLAAALQILAHVGFRKNNVHVRVQIGKPIYAKDLGTTETEAIHQAVIAEMKRLIENPPQSQGVRVP